MDPHEDLLVHAPVIDAWLDQIQAEMPVRPADGVVRDLRTSLANAQRQALSERMPDREPAVKFRYEPDPRD